MEMQHNKKTENKQKTQKYYILTSIYIQTVRTHFVYQSETKRLLAHTKSHEQIQE